MRRRRVILLALGLIATGCSSSTLRVGSAPEGADVTIVSPDRPPVKVGKTPIDIESRNYPELFQNSMQIEVSKEGHAPLSVVVPRLPAGAVGRVNLNLKAMELPKVCQAQSESVNALAKGIADAASLVSRRRLDEAVRLLQELSVKYDSVPVIHDLLGNVFYLQKNMERALQSYRHSNRLNPNNIETQRMIERIEQLQGRGAGG